jgi:hypothetical protein
MPYRHLINRICGYIRTNASEERGVSFQISVFIPVRAPPAGAGQEMEVRTEQLKNWVQEEHITHLSNRVDSSVNADHTHSKDIQFRISAGTQIILSIFVVFFSNLAQML